MEDPRDTTDRDARDHLLSFLLLRDCVPDSLEGESVTHSIIHGGELCCRESQDFLCELDVASINKQFLK